MVVELDFRSHTPIYVQIVERIKHLVGTEALKPGQQLPTVRQLATDLRVNFNTVARAYRILDEAGIISTQQGRGTYVLEPPLPEDAKRMRDAALDALSRSYLLETHRLGFKPQEVEGYLLSLLAKWRDEGSPPDEA